MRGSLQDISTILIILLSGIIAVFIGYHFLSSFLASSIISGSAGYTAGLETNNSFLLFDYMFLVFVVSGVLIAAILASMVQVHIAFLPFVIFFAVGVVYSASVVKQVLTGFLNNILFAGYLASFPNTILLVDNLEAFTAISCFIVLVAMYGKNFGRAQNGIY